jgi:hypothetical protein
MDRQPATGTLVEVAPGHLTAGQGKIVAAPLVHQAEISACLPPLRAVWRNAAPASAMMREEMSEFVF